MMDNMRGHFPDAQGADEDMAWDRDEDDIGVEAPPSPVGQEERRMQVRAYNHWVGLLGPRQYPAIGQLKVEELGDFGPHAVLLDLRGDVENPEIPYVGAALAGDIGDGAGPARLADVPPRSLLSRITDHYMQILANQAPIGFEAEFTNQHGNHVLYRGILLPFSEDDRTISHILGVINGKHMAEAELVEALELQLAQMLPEFEDCLDDEAESEAKDDGEPGPQTAQEPAAPLPGWLVEWAHGPDITHITADMTPQGSIVSDLLPTPTPARPHVANDRAETGAAQWSLGQFNFPMPSFGRPSPPAEHSGEQGAKPVCAATPAPTMPPGACVITPVALINALAAARAAAQGLADGEAARAERLLTTLGLAHDLALAAASAPQAFGAMIAEAKLDGAGLDGVGWADAPDELATAVLRLVFGADNPHLELGRHGLLINHALRLGLPAGSLVPYLATAPGGIAGVLAEARRLNRIAHGDFASPCTLADPALSTRLQALPGQSLGDLPAEGASYSLLVARRGADGTVRVLGEVTDAALLAKAASQLG